MTIARDADDVPPDGDVVEQRDQPDAERVQQGVDDQHDPVDRDRDGRRDRRTPNARFRKAVVNEGEPEVDAGRDRDLADEVEPADEPAPGAPVRGRMPAASLADQ